MEYVATMDNGRTPTIEARSLGEAVDIAVWEYSDGAYVLSVEPTYLDGGWAGEWMLVGDGSVPRDNGAYPTKQAALDNADDGESVWIAIPKVA